MSDALGTHSALEVNHELPKPLTVRVREACRLTGIGRSKLYELIQEGEIEIVKVGAITLIPLKSLEMFLERLVSTSN